MSCAIVVSPLRRDITAETYQDLLRMIQKVVHRHVKRYGGDYEELFAEAGRILSEHLHEYDPSKGYMITTFVYNLIRRDLLDIRRQEIQRDKRVHFVSLEGITESKEDNRKYVIEDKPECASCNIMTLIASLGDDCKNIVSLFLYPPQDFCEEMNALDDVESWRNCLREYLHFRLKWGKSRIEKSFQQITEAINQ